jgi:hypothetical protein
MCFSPELMELINQVFAYLDSKQAVDIRSEKAEVTADRMIKFLKILDYQTNYEV